MSFHGDGNSQNEIQPLGTPLFGGCLNTLWTHVPKFSSSHFPALRPLIRDIQSALSLCAVPCPRFPSSVVADIKGSDKSVVKLLLFQITNCFREFLPPGGVPSSVQLAKILLAPE